MKLSQSQYQGDSKDLLLPVANYDFEVIAAEEKPNAKSSDGVMTKVSLRVTDPRNNKPRKIKMVMGLWKNGAKTIKSFLESLGLDPFDEYTPQDFIGLTGTLKNKHGEFNGDAQDEVAFFIPLRPGQKPPAALYQPATVTVSDDDVPF